MNTRILGLTVALFSLASQVSPCAEPSASGSLVDYLVKVQATSMEPVIAYCVKQTPELGKQLEAEFSSLKEKLIVASAPLLDRATRDLPRSLTAEEKRQLESLAVQYGAARLDAARQADPARYCPMVFAQLRSLTVEALRAQIDTTYNQYVEAAARKKLQLGAQ